MHKLLERQIKKHFGEDGGRMLADSKFANFCEAIQNAYVAHEDDRELLERSLEVSSRELNEKNRDLQTARHNAESANKAKSSFLANMSHEMRTPLNAIIGYSELILEELGELSHDEIALELDKIRTSGSHLLGLINNVLDLAKIESGHMDVTCDVFDAAVLAKETCTMLQSQALKNKNSLSFEVDADSTLVSSDKAKVKQILINLTGNALKFTNNGTVKIRVARNGDGELQISVQDSGIGMSPENLEKLFQPFVQAEKDTQKKFGGTGLGLAISKKFAELIEGSLTAESTVGQGSRFILRLKDLKTEESRQSTRAQPLKLQNALSSKGTEKRVLVVDDDPNAVELMRRFLGRHGFECISLNQGTEAVEEAKRIRPSVILLDVFLPEIDGWTILSKLKADPETQQIPVIFTTMTDERSVGLSLGAMDYFTKPIEWERLARVLKSFERTQGPSLALLTEAEPTARKTLMDILRGSQWQIVEAMETQQFGQSIATQKFDLVILDCLNPQLETLRCIQLLNTCQLNQTTPVLCCTDSQHPLKQAELLQGRVRVLVTDDPLGAEKIESFMMEMLSKERKAQLP